MTKKLFLFTEVFPYHGGEPFLETEILYLANAFDEILIFPLEKKELTINLPDNVKVISLKESNIISLKKFVFYNFKIYFHWFVSEFILSSKRAIYIKNFKPLFYRLTGLIKKANDLKIIIKKEEGVKKFFYTYWFNDWGSILSIIRKNNKNFEFISRVHLFDFEEEFHPSGLIPFRYTEIKKTKIIVPISNYAKQYLNKMYRYESNFQHLGVKSFGFNLINSENKYTIVTCSSLSWYKRPMLLMELIKQLTIPIKWVHFGDGDMKNEFIESSKRLPSNIEFIFKGFVPNSDIIEFYKTNSVNVVLNVSSFEGIPVSLMEAISFGIPILGCNVCGIPEIVNDQTGILLDKDFDIKIAAIRISEFLIQKSSNIEYRKNVKEFWFKNFNADINYPQFIKNYLN